MSWGKNNIQREAPNKIFGSNLHSKLLDEKKVWRTLKSPGEKLTKTLSGFCPATFCTDFRMFFAPSSWRRMRGFGHREKKGSYQSLWVSEHVHSKQRHLVSWRMLILPVKKQRGQAGDFEFEVGCGPPPHMATDIHWCVYASLSPQPPHHISLIPGGRKKSHE